MADRRMFAMTIMDSDAFLDLPLSSQALYVHLCMRADDDGFLNNAKKIQRMVGADEADLQELLERRFLISFPSGVVVIKHWRMHNYIKKDRYKETVYTEEKGQLDVKKNGSYTEGEQFGYSSDTLWNQFGYSLEPQVRVRVRDRVRVSKENLCPELEQSPSVATEEPPVEVIISLPILGGKEFPVTKKHYNTFVEAYPGVSDIMAELKKMKAWLVANPKNMKKDVLRFANNWLSRENDKKGNRPSYGRQKAIGRVSTESGSLQTSPDDYNSL